jgi:hypothetical protein
MLIPDHTKNFFAFVENRSSGLSFWSLDNLLFYPRSFLQDYSPHWAVGAVVLLLGCLPLLALPELSEARKVLGMALLLAGLAVCLHPYKQARFFFTVAPLLWLSAAASVGWLLDRATRGWRVSLRQGALALTALAGLCVAALLPPARGDLAAAVEWRSVPAEVRETLNTIVQAAKPEEELWVFGVWNGLSPGLLQWQARILDPARSAASLPVDGNREIGGDTARRLDRLASSDARLYAFLGLKRDSLAWTPDFDRETAGVRELRRAVATDERLELARRAAFRDSGYRLWIYRASANGR